MSSTHGILHWSSADTRNLGVRESLEGSSAAAFQLSKFLLGNSTYSCGTYDVIRFRDAAGSHEKLAEALVTEADHGVVRGTYVGGAWRQNRS